MDAGRRYGQDARGFGYERHRLDSAQFGCGFFACMPPVLPSATAKQDKEAFDGVFEGLEKKFTEPQAGVVRPTLGMRGNHQLRRERLDAGMLCSERSGRVKGTDEVGGGVIDQAAGNPLVLIDGHFVAERNTEPVPAATRVGEVKDAAEIHIEIGFAYDAIGMIIVVFPKVAPVPLAGGCAVHAYSADGVELTKVGELLPEVRNCCPNIAIRKRYILVMVTNLVSECRNGANVSGLVARGNDTEIVGGTDAQLVLNLRRAETVGRACVHIVAENHKTRVGKLGTAVAVLLESQETIARRLQGNEQLAVCAEREIACHGVGLLQCVPALPTKSLRADARLKAEILAETAGTGVVHIVGNFLDGVVGIEENLLDFANGDAVDDVGGCLARDLPADIGQVFGCDCHLFGIPTDGTARGVIVLEELDKTVEKLVEARLVAVGGEHAIVHDNEFPHADTPADIEVEHVENLEDNGLREGIGDAVAVGTRLLDVEVNELLVRFVELYLTLVHVYDGVLLEELEFVVPVGLHAQAGIDDIGKGVLRDTEDKTLEVRRVEVLLGQEIGRAKQQVVLCHFVTLLPTEFDAQPPCLAHDCHYDACSVGGLAHHGVQIVGHTNVLEWDNLLHNLFRFSHDDVHFCRQRYKKYAVYAKWFAINCA